MPEANPEIPDNAEVLFQPSKGPQTHFLSAGQIYELFFGGARGGGKSIALLLDWFRHATKYAASANGLLVRLELTQLADLIRESHRLYNKLNWTWRESSKEWISPDGAKLRFAHLADEKDAAAFQGWSTTWIGIDEIQAWPRPEPIFTLMATLRSPNPDVKLNFRATGNPGGPLHSFCKRRWIDPAPGGYKVIADPETGLQRMFIPSKVTDNPYLDEAYIQRIKMAAPNKNILKGWLDGNWDFVEGGFYEEWSPLKHVIRPFRIPDHWPRFVSFDPGSNDPAALVWGAIVPDDFEQDTNDGSLEYVLSYQGGLPRGAMVIYRELYFAKQGTDTGLKLAIEVMADRICADEKYQIVRGTKFKEPMEEDGRPRIAKRVAGHDLFAHTNGPSLAERMAKEPWRLNFALADNTRVPRKGRFGGWNMIRWRLQGKDGRPMLYIFDSCPELIRCLPALQISDINAEDVADAPYDHLPDALRMLCMSRPWIPENASTPNLSGIYNTFAKQSTMIVALPPKDGWDADLHSTHSPKPKPIRIGGRSRRIQ